MERILSYIRLHLLGWLPGRAISIIKFTLAFCIVAGTLVIVERAIFPDSDGVWAKAKKYSMTLNRTAYWGYRYYTHTNAVPMLEPARRAAGTLDGMTQDGEVLLRIYAGGNIYQIQAVLADLDIRDLIVAAKTVNEFQRQRVTVDYYQMLDENNTEEGQVVVWLMDGNPLNEVLILNGSADATPTPPVNIVNRLMFNYYRREMRNLFSFS